MGVGALGVLFSVLHGQPPVADWFVSKTGADTNGGQSSGDAYLTVAKAISVAVAGEIIEVEVGRYDENLKPTSSGTDGSEITIRSKTGDFVRLCATSGTDTKTFDMDNVSYWVIKGFTIGDADLTWDSSDMGRGVTNDSSLFYQNNAHHIDVVDCHIWGGRGINGHGSFFQEGVHHIRVKGGSWGLIGSNDDVAPNAGNDRGDVFQSRAHQVIVEDVDMHHGGHDLFIFHGHGVVMRGCDLDNDWTDKHGGAVGARLGSLSLARKDRASTPFGPALFENNTFRNFKASVDNPKNDAHKVTADGPIIRGNYYFDGTGACIGSSLASIGSNPQGADDNAIQKIRFYNNTAYNIGGIIRTNDLNDDTSLKQQLENSFKNNIADQLLGQVKEEDGTSFYYDTKSYNVQGHPDDWFGAIMAGNMFKTASLSFEIRLSPFALVDVAQAEIDWPNVWTTDNLEQSPTWTDVGTDGSRTKAGFVISSGTGIGDAVPLTHVTSSSTGAVLTLDDTFYFYDGFDLAYFGEDQKMDYIKIVSTGQDPASNGTVVRITYQGRNDSLSQVTIDQDVAATAGDDVYLVSQDGSTVWDNRGASQ